MESVKIKEFMFDIITKTNDYSKVPNDVVEQIFKTGTYHGLWSGDNYGEYDRENTVNNFIETVKALTK